MKKCLLFVATMYSQCINSMSGSRMFAGSSITSSSDVAIRFVTSGFVRLRRVCSETGDAEKAYTQSDSEGGITVLTPQPLLKLTHQRVARTGFRRQSHSLRYFYDSLIDAVCYATSCIVITSYRPGGGKTMAVRLAADLRPSADRSAVRTWLSCRQPACL